MALEIKPTPTLHGESAERFLKLMAKNKKKKVPAEKRKQMMKNCDAILKKAKL